ncbi:MAG: hypothetical protein OEN02_04415 [Gammaproteobacteria bacterium]|nr:hypothetical protein [Gammaproteobacteria bacterium]MDH3535110.1 hypothetical protein [Gammaproteobacteria bacterium]
MKLAQRRDITRIITSLKPGGSALLGGDVPASWQVARKQATVASFRPSSYL